MDTEYPGKNASDLVFFRNKEEMQPQFISIINGSTISLDVERPPPAEDMYYCKLRLHNQQDEAVCLNKVVVGCKYCILNNIALISSGLWDQKILRNSLRRIIRVMLYEFLIK